MNASGQIVSLLFSLFSIMAFAQGPWVILFSRYRGSCLSSARRLSSHLRSLLLVVVRFYTQLYSIDLSSVRKGSLQRPVRNPLALRDRLVYRGPAGQPHRMRDQLATDTAAIARRRGAQPIQNELRLLRLYEAIELRRGHRSTLPRGNDGTMRLGIWLGTPLRSQLVICQHGPRADVKNFGRLHYILPSIHFLAMP